MGNYDLATFVVHNSVHKQADELKVGDVIVLRDKGDGLDYYETVSTVIETHNSMICIGTMMQLGDGNIHSALYRFKRERLFLLHN